MRLSPTLALLAALLPLAAQPTPTPIADTIRTATAAYFRGQVKISWPAFTASDGSLIARGSVLVPVVAIGNFQTALVPTTTALSPAFYTAVYANAAGLEQFTEFWSVPPSATPLSINNVKVLLSSTPSPGVSIGDQTPAGLVNGVNAAYTLTASPIPVTSLQLFRNGLLMRRAVDYNLSGSAIAFLSGAIPQPGDILAVWFTGGQALTTPAPGSEIRIGDESPFGIVDGVNAAFTLSAVPNPVASLQLFKNGLLMRRTVDYNLVGPTVAFVPGAEPQTGDILAAWFTRRF